MKLEQSKVNTELMLFCPRKSCKHYQSKTNKITKDGVYRTKNDGTRRQMFKCNGGNHRFSETGYSDLFGKHGSYKEYEQTAKLIGYGLNDDAIADVLEKDTRTIQDWGQAVGKKANIFHTFIALVIQFMVTSVQLDELWSFLGYKKKQLWVFASIDAPTRFWLNFELGSRTTHTAIKLVKGLKEMLGNYSADNPLKITTDKLAAYQNALQTVLGTINYVYLQIVKRRVNKRLVTVKKCFVKGSSTDFTGKTQNTSFIERLNLTLRQRVSCLKRKSLSFCKNKSTFKRSLWINLFNYNYCREHKSLRLPLPQANCERFQKRWLHQTPAMAMGLTQEKLSWRFLILAPIPVTN